jgi:hypothetical protein
MVYFRRQNLLIGGIIILIIGLVVWNITPPTMQGDWVLNLIGQIVTAIGAICIIAWLILWAIDEVKGTPGPTK